MAEVNAAQRFFMEKQGVSKIEDIKAEPGFYGVPIGSEFMKVEITDDGYMCGFTPISKEEAEELNKEEQQEPPTGEARDAWEGGFADNH